MKKKELYREPETSVVLLNPGGAILATSQRDFDNGTIAPVDEEEWLEKDDFQYGVI